VITINDCVKNFGCSVIEAIEAATLHPAKLLGIHNVKGILNNVGADADDLYGKLSFSFFLFSFFILTSPYFLIF
jgi:hypothetical protein